MYFFTEPSKLDVQSSGQEFGAIDENQFRLGNMFSSSAIEAPKAFAITDGLILVQKIDGVDKYNIVLKPSQQPDLNLPKIDYIIYKGIKKESIINGNIVANENNNDLTRIIHQSAQLWYQNEGVPMPSTEPSVDTSLGLIYEAGASDQDYQLQNTDSLNEAFYSNNPVTLPFVFSGNYIGDFDKTGDFGIVIIFEKIGFQPTFQLARELDSVMEFTPINSGATNAELFRRKHEKENILCFVDSAAFFGSFFNHGISVFDGGGFVEKTEDDLYNDVITKFLNKNKLYIDIRNEYNDSFNYYENYNNTIQWSLDNTDTLVNVNYYRNDGWPIFVIDDDASNSEFDNSNVDKIIKFSFPRGDNESPLFYYKKAYKEDLGIEELPDGEEAFYSPPVINDEVALEDLIAIKVGDRVSANYFQIKYIRRIILENDESNDFPRQGHTLFKRSYLDNLFPIFDMHIPFTNDNYTNLKLYYDSSFIDKILVSEDTLDENLTDYALRDFSSTSGIASDTNNITFISFPFKYHTNSDDNDDFIPVSGLESNYTNPFLIELNNLISQVNLVRSSFLINGVEQEYLNFINNQIVNGEQNTNQYSFDDVIILSITRDEYDQLEQLKQQNFNGPYKVYLGIKNISVSTDDNGNHYSSFTYVLRGLNENNGEIEPIEVVSLITSITSDSVIGINSGHVFPIDTPYISSDYGWRTLRGRRSFHNGIDFVKPIAANTSGSPIYAAKGGTITRLVTQEDGNGGGVRVRIQSSENPNIEYNYFHMLTDSNDHLSLGQVVNQGDQIGEVGSTGSSTAPHLHFEVWNGTLNRIDPYSIFPELALLPYTRHRDD